MSDDVTDWKDLPAFRAVDLTRSFVLSWELEREMLLIDIDLYLTPEHESYEPPRPAERVCIRPATLEFPYCSEVRNMTGNVNAGLHRSVRSLGGGQITAMSQTGENSYRIQGEFGIAEIESERPILRLKPHLQTRSTRS